MPAHTRSPLGNPPDPDESPAPSPLFTSSFDRATLEATVPFADKSIFVASDGRRFLFESIPDGSGSGRGSGGGGGGRKGYEDGSRISQSALASAPPRGRAPESTTHASIPKDHSDPNSPPVQRRPASNASTLPLYTPATPADSTQRGDDGTEPKALTQEVAEMMGDLSMNHFSATPFFAHSDGGVQAAETLTDPHPVPGLPIPQSPALPALTLARLSPDTASYYRDSRLARTFTEPNWDPQVPILSSRLVDVNFDFHQPQADELHELEHRPSYASGDTAHVSTRHPSLLEGSMPISPATTGNRILLTAPSPMTASGHQTPRPQPGAPYAPPMPQASPPTNYQYSLQAPRHQPGTPYTSSIPQASPPTNHQYSLHDEPRRASGSISHSVHDDGRRANGVTSPFDTQTPVVVIDSNPDPSSNSSRSDGASTSRDNLLPGEDILYDGRVNLAQSLSAPFMDGSLKVFRNNLSNELRFYCRVGYGSETYWMKGTHAQIVPVYAYDQRFPNVLYVRDNDSEKRKGYGQATQDNGRPSEVYQFARFQELCEFQAKLTGEKVVLDISSVKLVRLSKATKAHSRSNETFSSVRVQIWHEEEARRSSQSDVASFVTAGTTLSGPLRDRLVPCSSRLIVFLGRLDEYITVFVTDDIEVVPEGQTTAKIKARKGGSVFKRGGSRWAGVKAHRETKKGSEPAGLNMHGQGIDPDSVASFDLYETFEIEFESSPSQDNFVRKWQEVLKERRLQRKALERIHEEIRQATFSAKTAREIVF